MYDNPFRKKDPLLEAVKGAMQDGETRRQAEAYVNEQFGVYSRKAVVREHLAAYDAALEEAYKCMKEGEKKDEPKLDMKAREKAKSDYSKMREKMVGKGKDLETTRKIVGEAKKLADKDYDMDGNVEPPKDEVWGSRLRAAKMAGKLKEEEQIDELSYETVARYHRKAAERFQTGEEPHEKRAKGREMATRKRAGGMMGIPRARVMAKDKAQVKEGMMDPRDSSVQGSGDVTSTPAKHVRAPNMKPLKDPRDSSVQGSGDVTSGGKPVRIKEAQIDELKQSTIRSYIDKAHARATAAKSAGFKKDYSEKKGKKAEKSRAEFSKRTAGLGMAGKKLDEAKYSAKAARAGEDIGKPGKMFSKIAAKAGEKYGSEERGKKVAGAILAKIRAKHKR